MAKFQMQEVVSEVAKVVARLGAGTGSSNNVDDKELGKIVKLVGDSRYNLAAAGDPIEGFVVAIADSGATSDGYTIGSVQTKERKRVRADGIQATPGTGTIAINDFVVTGTVVAKGTAIADYPKVCKATMQPGVTEAGAVGDVNDMLKVALFPWRVVAILSGTGAVGDLLLIERV